MEEKINSIRSGFEELKEKYVKEDLVELYNDIYMTVKDSSVDLLAKKIISQESKNLNVFYIRLDKETHQSVVKIMKELGVPDESIPLIWARARKNVRSPKFELCGQMDFRENSREKINIPSQKRDSRPDGFISKKAGKGIAIAGAAIEGISWIFIPAYKGWLPVVKGLGVLMIATGAGSLALNYYQKPPVVRITLTEEARKQSRQVDVGEICSAQCKLNQGIFNDWLNQVCDAVIRESEVEMKWWGNV